MATHSPRVTSRVRRIWHLLLAAVSRVHVTAGRAGSKGPPSSVVRMGADVGYFGRVVELTMDPRPAR